MNLIQQMEFNQMTIQDFIKNREKVAGKANAIKELTSALEVYDKDTRKSILTPFGSEIMSQDSVISTKVRPVTLRDRLLELEALSKRVMDRKILAQTLADMEGEDDGIELTDDDTLDQDEDLSFGAGEYQDPAEQKSQAKPDTANGGSDDSGDEPDGAAPSGASAIQSDNTEGVGE